MSFFVKATRAPRPKTEDIAKVSLAFAAFIILMAVAQLFTFEKLSGVMSAMWLPGGDVWGSIYAAGIVTLEVIALPFLLSMKLSPLMRLVSMGAGWSVVAFWLFVSLWQNLTVNVIGNNGFLGATIALPVGWWSVFVSVALGVLAAWVGWGMWPLLSKSAK